MCNAILGNDLKRKNNFNIVVVLDTNLAFITVEPAITLNTQ